MLRYWPSLSARNVSTNNADYKMRKSKTKAHVQISQVYKEVYKVGGHWMGQKCHEQRFKPYIKWPVLEVEKPKIKEPAHWYVWWRLLPGSRMAIFSLHPPHIVEEIQEISWVSSISSYGLQTWWWSRSVGKLNYFSLNLKKSSIVFSVISPKYSPWMNTTLYPSEIDNRNIIIFMTNPSFNLDIGIK